MDAGINNVIYMELYSGPKMANGRCGKTIDTGTIDRGSTVYCYLSKIGKIIKLLFRSRLQLLYTRLNLYVPVTVHREQSMKREYQRDATIQMFIVNFRCLLLTTVSTCFGHPLCSITKPLPATSSTTSTNTICSNTRSLFS